MPALILAPVLANAGSALMDDIRVELPPEETIPQERVASGIYSLQPQSVYGNGTIPVLTDSVVGQIPAKSVSVGRIQRFCIVPGCEIDFGDITSSPPGVDVDIIKYFGIEIEAGVSGRAEVGYELVVSNNSITGITVDGTVPIKVDIKLPAANTVAPGQKFYIDSEWTIDESGAQRLEFNTSDADYFDLDTTLTLDFDFSLATTVCVFGCIDINITITWPKIGWRLFDLDFLPFQFCALYDRLADNDKDPDNVGFCPLRTPDLCDPFIKAGLSCPYISIVDEDPFNHYPIPGLEDVAPGSATIDILKIIDPTESVYSEDEAKLIFETTARNQPLHPRKSVSSNFSYALAGMTLDFANAAAALVALPPLNGSLTDLFAARGKSLNPIAQKAADLFSYNAMDASLGFDFVLGHDFELTARAPRIRVQYTDANNPLNSIDESFRAGGRKLITMPDDLDPGNLSISIIERPPRFRTRVAAPIDPRFEVSAVAASINVPGVGEVASNPIFQTGDVLPSPPPFFEVEFDAAVAGGFGPVAEYDLAPRTRPFYITGTVLNQPDASTNIPRFVTNCRDGICEEINLAIVDLTTGSNNDILVSPPGLQTRNTQFVGGVFNLMLNQNTKTIETSNGTTTVNGTYLVLGGNSLMPGFDGTSVNLALAATSNSCANGGSCTSGEVQGGIEFSSNDGAYIRNSTMILAPFDDGTIAIVDDIGSQPSFDILPPAPVVPDLTVKGRLAVYSGNNTNSPTNPLQVVDLDIANSNIRAVEFLLAQDHVHSPKPIIVTLDDSTAHANLLAVSGDSQLLLSGNSLFAGRDLEFNNSENRGLIDVRGRLSAVDESPVASSLLDTGREFRNISNEFAIGTIAVGSGGVVSVRNGNSLSSSGKMTLAGSYSESDAAQAIVTLTSMSPGYSADDLFGALVANPTRDAVLIVDGGTVADHAISSQGGTILGRAGTISNSTIDTDDARLVVEGGVLSLTESLLAGSGTVDIGVGSVLSLTAGGLVDNAVVPVMSAEGLQTSDEFVQPAVFARRTLEIVNDGSIEIAAGPSSGNAVEVKGDALLNGHLAFRNQGDVVVASGQQLQFRGDARVENSGGIRVDTGGTLSLLDQATPGEPVGPIFVQLDGLTTINGTVSFGTNGVASNNVLELSGGTLDGSGSIGGEVRNVGGTVAPGSFGVPNGVLAIDSYVQHSSGQFQASIGPLGHSQLDVRGTISLVGSLVVEIDAAWWRANPDTVPLAVGQDLSIINHGGSSGEFETVTVRLDDGTPVSDYTFDISYDNPTTVVITFREVDETAVAEGIYEPERLGRFQDVYSGSFAFQFIEKLAEAGITSGCGGGNFCPNARVTRAQMAVFLERGMNGSDYVPPPASGTVFSDVAAGDFAANFIEQLYADGITSGCGNNNYCPNDSVSRAQIAVFLLRAKYGSGYSPPAATGVFNDVTPGYWAANWIEQLSAEAITSGCGNSNYCPGAPVTRAQMAVFLVRTFGL